MMSVMPKKDRDLLRKLHGQLNSDNENVFKCARKKINELLKASGKTWNDVSFLLSDKEEEYVDTRAQTQPSANVGVDFDRYTPADLVYHTFKQYTDLKHHELIATTLWVPHTHVFDRFMVTPRLLLTSPVRGCGKTTVLDLILSLAARAEKHDHITAAAIFHAINAKRPTLLLDEVDNLGLAMKQNNVIRAVLNSGHRYGGFITRMVNKEPKNFSTFAPVALAAINGTIPLPVKHRAIGIPMQRALKEVRLSELNKRDPKINSDLDIIYGLTCQWAGKVELNLSPDMPKELRNRARDNWRPLISVADACGPPWGKLARDAAVAMCKTDSDEDAGVLLLADLRDIFNARKADKLWSKEIIAALVALEDAPWSEWRGEQSHGPGRKINQNDLAGLLRPFNIRPRSVRIGGATSRGYYRHEFEDVWRRYCDDIEQEGDTTTQALNIRYLFRG